MKKFMAVLLMVAVIVGAKMFYIDRNAQKDVEAHLHKVDGFMDVQYDKVSMDVLGWKPRMKNVTISARGSDAKTDVESIVIYEFDEEHEIPLKLDIGFEGVTMEVNETNFGAQSEALTEMGYEEIQAKMRLHYEYNMEEKEFILHEFRFGSEDMGHITAELHLSNIDLNPDTLFFLLMSWPNIRIHKAELGYEDKSLLPRVQTFVAGQQGKTVDEVIKEMTDEIDKELAAEENTFNQKALKALKKFVKDPDEITIEISPKEPVPLGKLQGVDPAKVPEILNIKIRS